MYNTKKIIINKVILSFVFSLFGNILYSQTEFFNSKIDLSDEQLGNFYSSISIDSLQVYFMANDYNVYTYDKKTGEKKWSHYAAQKSNAAPNPHQNHVFINTSNSCEQVNSKTGETIQSLEFQSMGSQPFFKDGIMYCTGVASGGSLMAYDLKSNKILWQEYISHGCETQPYYFKNKIVANAEGGYWKELGYNGKLRKEKSAILLFTHDQKEISEDFLENYFVVNFGEYFKDYFKNYDYENKIKVKHGSDFTAAIISGGNKMLFIGNNKKINKVIAISKIITVPETGDNEYKEILKVDDSAIWFVSNNAFCVYDYKNDKTLQIFDLTKWNPYQVILDSDNLWVISKNDGQLYGLKLD